MKIRIILLLNILALVPVFTQEMPGLDDVKVLKAVVIDGDTVLLANIDEVYVFGENKFKNRWEAWKYRRLVKNVKKAYPYAKLAGDILKDVNDHLLTLKTEKERKDYIKQVEDELFTEYEDELKKLTITQGRILIKLIDRETGDTSYNLVKELRGSFSAFFWQAIARVFGSNLKDEFDADGADKMIEEIVILIEAGYL